MRRGGWVVLLGWFLAAGLSGCAATPNSNFFVLSPGEAPIRASLPTLALSIGPVDLPRYLDRPQIVSRAGDNRLEVDEFNRWGGALDEEIARALTKQLGRSLDTNRVFSYPSRLVTESDYRVALDVQAFDGERVGPITFDLVWTVIDDRTGQMLRTEQVAYTADVRDQGVEAYVVALSQALALLGDDLAQTLLELASAQ